MTQGKIINEDYYKLLISLCGSLYVLHTNIDTVIGADRCEYHIIEYQEGINLLYGNRVWLRCLYHTEYRYQRTSILLLHCRINIDPISQLQPYRLNKSVIEVAARCGRSDSLRTRRAAHEIHSFKKIFLTIFNN